MNKAVPVVQSTTSRSVRILRELGLVEVFLAPHDGRVRLTRLSAVGRSFLAGLLDLMAGDQAKKTDRDSGMEQQSQLTS